MNKIFTIATFLLFTVSIPCFVLAQNTIIPDISETYLDKLIATAKANYPHVKALDHRVDVAKNNIGKAKVAYFDPFTVSYVYQPNNTLNLYQSVDNSGSVNSHQSLFNGAQFGLFFSLGSLLQKPYQVKQARKELLVATDEKDEYLITLATLVKKRYYTYLQRIAALKLQSEASIDAETMLKNVRYKFEKGEETLDNYTKARITLTQQNESKIGAEANLFLAKADLEELIGDKLENIK
ncbi:TolC family protein [Mucilaginibacter robiniae]|uniref:TolC family protein n=1 Tax=Mucilaginibacter robiniae TaxID=2728022 RepID=A0A7L5DX37_9SPHI|nr:TolC family protein [Mucilaginibacter robiniae]QJD94559.1 TolC family protein [Mucilaginibacter robiniae]